MSILKPLQILILLLAFEQVVSAGFFSSIFNPKSTIIHTPKDNETNVSSDVVIKLTYGENISQSFLSSENIVLTQTQTGINIEGTVSYTESDNTISFIPSHFLEQGLYHIKYRDILKKKSGFFFFSYITLESVEFNFEVADTRDANAPVITLNGNNSINLTKGSIYREKGATATDVEDGIVAVVVSGNVNTSVVGSYTLTYTATDSTGNVTTTSRVVNITEIPVVLETLTLNVTSSVLKVGETTSLSVTALYNNGDTRDVSNEVTYTISNPVVISANGSTIEMNAKGTSSISATFNGITSNSVVIEVTQEIDTTNFNVTNFGTQYIKYIPKDATKEKYDEELFCMITGKILAEDGSALIGAKVTIHNHPEYGSQITNSEGVYSFATEGGLSLLMRYSKDGYTTLDRKVYAKVQDWSIAPDVTMLEVDTKMTTINLSNTTPQIHISTPVIDERGERSTTLVFDNISKVTVTAKDGTTRELDTINVRATEFKTPESMPADLPSESAFTYCSDLKVDGVSDDENVTFNAPVVMYVDNFLGFDIGDIVPVGYYDRTTGKWKCSENGVVVSLLDVDGDGIVDALDSTGDGLPNDLNNNGSYEDEVAGIKDNAQYTVGKTYWRAKFTHFTPWDHNWPYGPPEDANNPDDPDASEEGDDDDGDECEINSYIKPKTRVFHEDIKVAGTGLTLHYSSKRVSGYKYIINASVNIDNVPSSVIGAEVKLEIAGQTLTLNPSVSELNNLYFEWDGKDSLGNKMHGKVNAKLSVAYTYRAVYYKGSEEFESAWSNTSGTATAVRTRQSISLWTNKIISVNTEIADSSNAIANGWTLSSRDLAYGKLIQQGNGNLIKNESIALYNVEKIADMSTRATPTTINGKSAYMVFIKADKDGNVYLTDTIGSRIYKRDTSGQITIFAGNGTVDMSENGGLATQSALFYPLSATLGEDGSFYFIDTAGYSIRKIDKNGILTTVAGRNIIDETVPESDIDFATVSINIDENGNLLYMDGLNSGVKKFIGCGKARNIKTVDSISVFDMDIDGNIYYMDSLSQIKKIDIYGKEKLVYDTSTDSSEVGSFILDKNANLFFVDHTHNRIVKVDSSGNKITILGDDELVGDEVTTYTWLSSDAKNNIYVSSSDGSIYKLTENRVFDSYGLEDTQIIHKKADNTANVFDKFGKEIKTIDLGSGTTLREFIYDGKDRLISSVDQFDNKLNIERDSKGNPILITAPNGQKTYLEVDDKGDLISVSYEDNSNYIFEYDENSLMLKETDQNSNEFLHYFDKNGRIYQDTDSIGGEWKFFKESSRKSKTYTMVKPENDEIVTTTVKQADGSLLSRVTLANGDSYLTLSSFDGKNINSEVNSVNTQTLSSYDEVIKRQVLESRTVTQPSGLASVSKYTQSYDKNETHIFSKTRTIDVNSKVTTIVDDYKNARKTLTTPELRVTTLSYDKTTRQTSEIKSGTLTKTSYTYDNKGRVTSQTRGTRETSYTYNNRGNIATATDSRGETTSYTYDVMDNLTKVTYSNGTTEEYSYDFNGNMTKLVTPTPTDHSFAYNGIDKRVNYTTPLNKVTEYSYNKNRRLTAITRPSGKTVTNNYEDDRLVSTTTPDSTTTYSYLFATKIGSITTGTESINYTYDGDLLTSQTQAGVLNQSINYTYNNDFKIDSSTYANITTPYTYDSDGLLTKSGEFTLTRDTANGYTTNVTDGTLTQTREYNNYGEITQVSDNTFTYKLSQRNNAGTITQKIETLNAIDTTYDYTYDSKGRLTTVSKNNQTVEEYTYDKNGNRTEATVNGVTTNAYYTLDDNVEVYGDNTYTYDEDGYLREVTSPTQTRSYTYNTLGALTQVTTPTKTIIYHLNANNQRVAKEVNGVIVEKYLWANLTTLLAIYDKDDNLVQRFNYADSRMPISMTMQNEIYYLHYDQVGTLKAVTDKQHNIIKEITYDTYGNILSDTNPDLKIPFGFAGGLHDRDTNLVHFGYREYEPLTGKWTAKDPIDFGGGDSNLYGYVLNDPINFIDSWGLASAYGGGHGQNRDGYTPLNLDVSKQCVVSGLSNLNTMANDLALLGIAAKRPRVVIVAEIIKVSSEFALTTLGTSKPIAQTIRDTSIGLIAPTPLIGEAIQQTINVIAPIK